MSNLPAILESHLLKVHWQFPYSQQVRVELLNAPHHFGERLGGGREPQRQPLDARVAVHGDASTTRGNDDDIAVAVIPNFAGVHVSNWQWVS